MSKVFNFSNVYEKLLAHWVIVGAGAGLVAIGAAVTNYAGGNLPVEYAAAVGLAVSDFLRVALLELRTDDPMPDEQPPVA